MRYETVDVHHLRRLWKTHKERLLSIREDHATPIRFHRACSWLSRVESMEDDDIDFALIAQWIALNSLYGQWDHGNRSPVADRECWRVFIDRIVDLDSDGRISELLQEHRPLVMSLFEDPYLSGLFWQDPTQERVGAAKRTRYSAQTWYFEKSWKLILENVVERVYLIRCQLIHGAATFGSKLNRRSLKNCSQMMMHLLPAIMLVLVEHGADEDWGIMCYPPITSMATARKRVPK